MGVVKHSYCEVFVRYVLPAIRLLIAKELVEKHGYTQLEAAKALGISQPLLNYFLTGRRTPKYLLDISKSDKVRRIVKYFADCIRRGDKCAEALSCTLCRILKEAGEVHRILNAMGIESEAVVFPLCIPL